MGGEASAPAAATAVLRFMVDLAKMCPPFSAVCRRPEFLESCIDLYFSCIRFVFRHPAICILFSGCHVDIFGTTYFQF
jgi:hypothetical protein